MTVGAIVGSILGGVGLFLLGMRLLTDGLRSAAGDALRDALERSMRTRFRAFATGAVITAIVQSSSAVTVATIGFVNAGLMGLTHAVWIIVGSNVGTTATGWLVALTGLTVDLMRYALPAVGVGMALQLTGPSSRRGALGQALAGFGLFFMGLSVLEGAFSGLAEQLDLGLLAGGSVGALLLACLLGSVLTAALQSSSAAVAITLTAAMNGVLDLQGAGAMVIGANLGTTSTAMLAVLGATPEAKRAAAAHVVFNITAAIVAMLLLPFMLDATRVAIEATGRTAALAAVLALFHTGFNLLGALLMWPLSHPLVRALEKRFQSAAEMESRPMYLDATVLAVPEVAFEAMLREMARVSALAYRSFLDIIGDKRPPSVEIREKVQAMQQLLDAVNAFMARLERGHLTPKVSVQLQRLVKTSEHFAIVAEQALILLEHREALGRRDMQTMAAIEPLVVVAREVAMLADPSRESFDPEGTQRTFGAFQERFERLSEQMLSDAGGGWIEPARVWSRQRLMTEIRRAVKHMARGAKGWSEARSGAAALGRPDSGSFPVAKTPSAESEASPTSEGSQGHEDAPDAAEAPRDAAESHEVPDEEDTERAHIEGG